MGTTNISFIICSERLICSPRRVASSCPLYTNPTSLSLFLSLSFSFTQTHAHTHHLSLSFPSYLFSFARSPFFPRSLSIYLSIYLLSVHPSTCLFDCPSIFILFTNVHIHFLFTAAYSLSLVRLGSLRFAHFLSATVTALPDSLFPDLLIYPRHTAFCPL